MLRKANRAAALVILGLLLAVALWCLFAPAPPSRVGTMQVTDTSLYTMIVDGLRAGHSYYDVATSLQRQVGAPLQPAFTVRLPTLALVLSWIGLPAAHNLALLGLAACMIANAILLDPQITLTERALTALATLAGGMLVFVPQLVVWHEVWAGLLLGLALACYCGGRTLASALFAAAAVSLRELALPFVLLALALAACDRNRRELRIWAAVLVGFVVYYTIHLAAVRAHVLPGDLRSPGWDGLRGLPAITDSLHDLTLLGAFPQPLAYFLALLPLLGWAALPQRAARFAVLFHGGYGLMLALFARADNYYWAGLVLPSWFAGLAFVPRAVAMLGARVKSHSGEAVQGRGPAS